MPNHIATILRVSGPQNSVEEFCEKAKKVEVDEDGRAKETCLSADALFPMPAELDTSKGGPPSPFSGTEQLRGELLEKCGYDNWYDWCIANWGTKWGFYDISESPDITETSIGTTAEYRYMTAWSPATKLFLKVSRMFPDLNFYHQFADEGGNFVGEETIANGEILHSQDYRWGSDSGISIRKNVGYYNEDADAEEEG
jgi:hypothetical protein